MRSDVGVRLCSVRLQPDRRTLAFPYLLLPSFWAARNRMRRRERGDSLRGLLFGGVGLVVVGALFWGAYWLTRQLAAYEEFGDYLLRLGLSWLFLSFLAFLAFSGIVTALSSFFLSDDLRLLMTSPIAARRLFAARFTRTLGSASWMVIIFMTPVLAGIGVGRCAPLAFYLTAAATVVPFAIIPVALGSACTLFVVNVFPARRARDLLMLMGLVFAAGIVLLLRFIQPERLLRVESLPDITDFFATLQSPITPLLPSFWAGEALFAGIQGGVDWLHQGALWTTAGAFTVLLAGAHERWHFAGYSRSQEAPKTRFAHVPRARCRRRGAAVVAGAAAAARQGREGVPARREPVGAAAAAARARAALSLQLPGARPRAHAVRRRVRQEHLRVRESRDGRDS